MSRAVVIITLAASALVIAPVFSGHGARFIWNASASVPIGLYAVMPIDRIGVADLVAVRAPEPLASFMVARGYIGAGVPMIKRVLAVAGTEICRHGATITVHGVVYDDAHERDSAGQDLPHWQGCQTIAAGEIFLMNSNVPDSFDGRYFGPLPKTSVIARVAPIWTDEAGDGRFVWRAPTR